MSTDLDVKLKAAFETIITAFEEKMNTKIHSIKGMDFVVEDNSQPGVQPSHGAFRLFEAESVIHPLVTQHCHRENGHWVCTRG
jgi:hypothetical protein